MQFIKNGPDIPERLLQAHEEGKVVFFCGAGISYPAGLPGFGGLVDNLYLRLGTTPTPVESVAKKSGLHDTAIGLLEGRIVGGRGAVRRHLAAVLTPDLALPRATHTHAALITLSQSRTGQIRLLTTNFDRVFEAVIAGQKLRLPTFKAPLLPVPKNRWSGLVYLHGLLPETPTEEELDRLVVASGDFGLAYLTERWAARFVSDLFRAYTICFVGYSISDPVMRYMMDALAADRLMGEIPAEAFAFGSYSKGKENFAEQEWRAKNVTPILYREHRNHYYLHKTLRVWANSYRDGVRGKEAIVARYATIKPAGSTKQDDFVRRMLWALGDSTGLPAKRFADFDPVPSLDWLEVLSERQFGYQDLSRFGVQPNLEEDENLSFSVVDRPTPYVYAQWMVPVHHAYGSFGTWDNVMGQLTRWLAKHVGNPKLLLWVAGRGGKLHPNFERLLTQEIEKNPPAPSMQKLWRLVLGGRLKSGLGSTNLYSWQRNFFSHGHSATVRLCLRDALTPYVLLRAPLRLPNDNYGVQETATGDNPRISDLVRWEIVLKADHVHSALNDLRQNAEWQAILPQLLPDATTLLRDAFDLMGELESASSRRDGSYVHQPSIADHPQNTDFNDWTALVELVRDAWLATADVDPDAAIVEVQKWLTIEYPLFRRLAFFAATHKPDLISTDDALTWLLADDHWWLWTAETQRETMRLLVSLSPRLTPEQCERLQAAVLQGPPRDMFRDDIKLEALQRAMDREVWFALKKLRTSGAELTAEAADRLQCLATTYPNWQLAADERDEFPFWTGNGEEWRTYRPTPKLRRELEAWLREYPSVDDRHETDNWAERCAKDFPRTTAALISLARESIWPTDRWRQALQVWSNQEYAGRSWRYVAPTLATIPDERLSVLAGTMAWWLGATAKVLMNWEEIFLGLIGRIIASYRDEAPDLGDEAVGHAINHPIGLSTSAVLHWWYRQNLQDGQQLRAEVVPIFEAICDPDTPGLHFGRIVLARSTIALYRVDREWTEQNLLAHFRWETSEENARSMWQSFLHSPRLYWPLLDTLKDDFLAAARRYDALGQTCARQYAAFLTYAALEPGGTFTKKDFRNAIATLPVSALSQIAETLFHALQGAGEQRVEFLQNRIGPFFRYVWPNTQEARTPAVSEQFAKLCAVAGDAFPEALGMFRDWLHPINEVSYVTHQLHKARLCERFPLDTLSFLHLIIPVNVQWLSEKLRECLRAMRAVNADIEQDDRFQRLVTLVQQHGQDWP